MNWKSFLKRLFLAMAVIYGLHQYATRDDRPAFLPPPPVTPAAPAHGLSGPAAGASSSPDIVAVVGVTDGDTIRIRLPDGTIERVRYIGIDTPELRPQGGGPPEAFATRARDRNRELTGDGAVRLEYDRSRRDRYGRLLAYVWRDGPEGPVMLNERLLAEGLAVLYIVPPDTAHRDRLAAAEARARASGLGLWNRIDTRPGDR